MFLDNLSAQYPTLVNLSVLLGLVLVRGCWARGWARPCGWPITAGSSASSSSPSSPAWSSSIAAGRPSWASTWAAGRSSSIASIHGHRLAARQDGLAGRRHQQQRQSRRAEGNLRPQPGPRHGADHHARGERRHRKNKQAQMEEIKKNISTHRRLGVPHRRHAARQPDRHRKGRGRSAKRPGSRSPGTDKGRVVYKPDPDDRTSEGEVAEWCPCPRRQGEAAIKDDRAIRATIQL